MTRITRSYIAPNPKEFDYWVDLAADPKGNVIKYYAGSSKWLPIAKIIDGVKVGANISYSNGTISLSKANVTSALGYTPPTADTKVTINNTLTSTSTTEALAAAQGKALKDLIDALTTRVAALETPTA